MAEEPNTHTTHTTTTGGSSTGLAFIVGILVVVVGLLAYFMFGGDVDGSDDVSVTIDGGAVEGVADAVEGAAQAVEGAAESATGN